MFLPSPGSEGPQLPAPSPQPRGLWCLQAGQAAAAPDPLQITLNAKSFGETTCSCGVSTPGAVWRGAVPPPAVLWLLCRKRRAPATSCRSPEPGWMRAPGGDGAVPALGAGPLLLPPRRRGCHSLAGARRLCDGSLKALIKKPSPPLSPGREQREMRGAGAGCSGCLRAGERASSASRATGSSSSSSSCGPARRSNAAHPWGQPGPPEPAAAGMARSVPGALQHQGRGRFGATWAMGSGAGGTGAGGRRRCRAPGPRRGAR